MGKSDEFVEQSSESEFITGHIDFLQVRDGYLKILDCKPDARKERHAHVQPTIYALALARRTNLPLKSFKCAWFDEKDYFEFFPVKRGLSARSAAGHCDASFLSRGRPRS